VLRSLLLAVLDAVQSHNIYKNNLFEDTCIKKLTHVVHFLVKRDDVLRLLLPPLRPFTPIVIPLLPPLRLISFLVKRPTVTLPSVTHSAELFRVYMYCPCCLGHSRQVCQ